jgi:DNA topoisomerase-1
LVVERERERIRFVAAGYWDLAATFATDPSFGATLVEVDGARVATGKDFDDTGTLTREGVVVLDEPAAHGLAGRLGDSRFAVRKVEEKPYRSSPKPPFMTSTLQQEGGRKLRLTARDVMRVAQGLYERGYITYMRTDSVALSETALGAARSTISSRYGAEYLPASPRAYASKVKNAQEAHEAIRPAGEEWRTPEELRGELSGRDLDLYELVWKRTVASQMADATGRSVSVRIGAASSSGEDAVFSASGRTITFPGYLRAYVEGSDDPDAELDDRESILPPLAEGDEVPLGGLSADGHSTNPPPRYTEASLVKRMEGLGVGRPSTYASVIGTIQERDYVRKRGTALVPTWTAFAVTGLLERHFASLVDYAFTARMEDDLDRIADHQQERGPWLHDFWFGNGSPGLHQLTTDGLAEIDPVVINSIPVGNDIVLRVGKYGPYLQRGEERASVPEDLAPDELTVAKAEEILAMPSGDRELGVDPETGLTVFAKAGRYGPYVQLGEVDAAAGPKAPKPKTASLLSTMALDTVTFDDAMRLLTLPRVVGLDPSDGAEITAQNGRYGPYLKKGTDSRSLENEEQMFTVTLEEAQAIFAKPKLGRGQRAAAAPPLKELGNDPVSGQPMVVKDGRFGPYVTDGETNASLRTGDAVETLTDERASELLQLRREAGPAKKRAKKAAPKKAAAKKKAAPKKAAAKKKAAPKKKAPPA